MQYNARKTFILTTLQWATPVACLKDFLHYGTLFLYFKGMWSRTKVCLHASLMHFRFSRTLMLGVWDWNIQNSAFVLSYSCQKVIVIANFTTNLWRHQYEIKVTRHSFWWGKDIFTYNKIASNYLIFNIKTKFTQTILKRVCFKFLAWVCVITAS